jgi:hypothetical protein
VQGWQDLEGISLVHQKLLALGTVVHLLSVTADEGVEVCTELFLLHSTVALETSSTSFAWLETAQRTAQAKTCTA